MNKLLQVQKRDQYGRPVFHPVNDVARTIAEIAGTKTLTTQVMALAQTLGFVIEVQPEPSVEAWRNRGGI